MNTTRLTKLYQFLKELPKGQFCYHAFLAVEKIPGRPETRVPVETLPQFIRMTDMYNCQTVACAAGWTNYLFKDEALQLLKGNAQDEAITAQKILGLTAEETTLLFLYKFLTSTREDALDRILFLLGHQHCQLRNIKAYLKWCDEKAEAKRLQTI